MTEEVKDEGQEKQEVQGNEMEVKALSMGWKPKELWAGAETDFIDAAEFVRRKPLFDKIESQKQFYDKKIRDVELTLNELAQHHAKVKEIEYQRALKELRLQKREAMKEGDTVAALDYEDRMEALEESHKEELKELPVVSPKETPSVSPDYLVWVKENEWYLKDQEMHDFAEGVALSFVQRERTKGNMYLTDNDVYKHVSVQVKKAFPEKFENPNRAQANRVVSGDTNGQNKKAVFHMTEEQEQIARDFERRGIMTREQYSKELKEMQDRGEL